MRLKIWHKLFLGLLTATAIVVVVTLVLTRWSFNRGFLDYINTIEAQRIESIAAQLADVYAQNGNWDVLLENPKLWRRLVAAETGGVPFGMEKRVRPSAGPADQRPPSQQAQARGSDRDDRRGAPGDSRPPPPPHDEQRGGANQGRPPPPPEGLLGVRQPIDLLDAAGNTLLGNPDQPVGALLATIAVNGATVGYVRYLPVIELTQLDETAEQQFVATQRAGLLGTAAVALLIAVVLALLFGRRLVAPIRTLASGTRALAAGDLSRRIVVSGGDELSELANDFNRMAAALDQARQAQRQWAGDIAHELRTPLAILTGELQAMEDGIREWNATNRASLQSELGRLNSLVDDLRDVIMAESGGMGYQWSRVDLATVCNNVLTSQRERIAAAGLTLNVDIPAGPLTLRGDARRLEQLFSNLLENSRRYTDAPGSIRVTCSQDSTHIYVHIDDTLPGVPATALPRLFDRLFRVDPARNRDHGGSGLGLAICKGIVEAHGGRIYAEQSALGGLAIKVELPREQS